MKKFVLRSFLVMMVLGLGLAMAGCPTDDSSSDSKVVAEKYRGTWVDQNDSSRYFTLEEKTIKPSSGYGGPAHTEGNALYNSENLKLGTFETDTSFKDTDSFIYIKQQQ